MAMKPTENSPSLDDLLQRHKEQFEQLVSAQNVSIGRSRRQLREPSDQTTFDPPTTSDSDTAAPAAPPQSMRQALAEATPAVTRPRVPTAIQQQQQVTEAVAQHLVESALRNVCAEMSTALTSLRLTSPTPERGASSPTIADQSGRIVAGLSGTPIADLLRHQQLKPEPGDIILQSDPYRSRGAVNHSNDWMLVAPIYWHDELIGFSSITARLADVGGDPGHDATVFGEGVRIPPVKLYQHGELNRSVLDLLIGNSRTPESNYADLMALVTACHAGANGVGQICQRFGVATYRRACQALLDRAKRIVVEMIGRDLPQEPLTFEDYVDDDGRGNGPFTLKLSVWREDGNAYFDWTGTSAQAPGPINLYLNPGLFKMFVGANLLDRVDPLLLLNEGFHDAIQITLPRASLLRPELPAGVGSRVHTLMRQFDVLSGVLNKAKPEAAVAAGLGAAARFRYCGVDSNGIAFQFEETLHGGSPGRSDSDGADGHSDTSLGGGIAAEETENHYPLIVQRHGAIADSAGNGQHRGGNGIEKVYLLLEPGEIDIDDDRHRSRAWGVLGGQPGSCSEKWLLKQDGSRRELPAKANRIAVESGDRIVFRTGGGGGWGDPLQRDPITVRNDVARRLLTVDAAREHYGVAVGGTPLTVERAATHDVRESLRRSRQAAPI